MNTFLAAAAIVGSLIAVAFQVRHSRKQGIEARRAEQVAAAFFDLYASWALNRRAQLEPVDTPLLRSSSAQFYAAAFRLSALVEGDAFEALAAFIGSKLGATDDEALDALWTLHCTVTRSLAYRRQPATKDELIELFWRSHQNVPGILLGRIDPSTINQLLSGQPS